MRFWNGRRSQNRVSNFGQERMATIGPGLNLIEFKLGQLRCGTRKEKGDVVGDLFLRGISLRMENLPHFQLGTTKKVDRAKFFVQGEEAMEERGRISQKVP